MSKCICGGCICMEGEGLREDLMDAGKKLVKKGSKLAKEKGEKLVKSAKKVGKKELEKLKDLEFEDLKDVDMKKVGKYVKKVGKEVVEGMDGEGMDGEGMKILKVMDKGLGKLKGKGMEGEGVKKPSKWIQHVKSVAKKEGISYTEAMKIASKTYQKN